MKPVPIPKYFNEIDNLQTALQATKFFSLWLAPGFISYFIFQASPSIAYSALPISLLSLIAGHGLQCVALLGHEGTHFSLHKDKWISAKLGIALSSFTPFHHDLGFAITHAEHHAFTNSNKDPDHLFFSKFKSFWSRLFLARIASSNRYFLATLKVAFNQWPKGKPIRLALSGQQIISLARMNLFLSTLISLTYIGITFYFPVLMIFVLWLPFVLVVFLSGLRPYVEHTQTKVERGKDSRSWISPQFNLLYGSINYHQAHHLHPRVPSYKLKELHNWMVDNNAGINKESIQIGSWKEFFKAAAKPL